MNERVEKAVLDAIRELNEDWQVVSLNDPAEDAVLLGAESGIDSMGLVMLIALVEENVKEALGTDLVLADDRAFSQKNSPFRNVGSLKAYVCECLEGVN